MNRRTNPMRSLAITSIARSHMLAVLVVLAMTVAACGEGPLPAADLSTIPAPTPTATPRPTSTPVPRTVAALIEVPKEQAEIVAAQAPTTGQAWQDVTANLEGLSSGCGNVSTVSSNPNRAQVIVGISGHGLFEYDAETTAWDAMGSGAGSARIDNRLGWIEFDALEPDRFWQAGSYGDGVFRTDDNGVTFTRLGDLRHLDYVSVDPTDPFRAVMMVGVHEEAIVYKSENAGATWQDISAELPADIGITSFPVVFSPSAHLLGTYSSKTAGIFRSQDGGATWSRSYEGAISGPPVVDGDTVLWLLEKGGGVLRSTDQGFSFERGEPTGGKPRSLTQLSDGRLVTHRADSLLISADLGRSWTPFGPPLAYEPRGVAISEAGGSAFIWDHTCNFGGGGNPVLPQSIMRLAVDFDQT